MRLASYGVVAAIGLTGCGLCYRGQAIGMDKAISMGQAFTRGNKKSRGQGGIAAFIGLGSAGGQGVGVSSHWGTSGILAWQTLRTFLLGWGVLAGKQS